jgi:hypothetical protein
MVRRLPDKPNGERQYSVIEAAVRKGYGDVKILKYSANGSDEVETLTLKDTSDFNVNFPLYCQLRGNTSF